MDNKYNKYISFIVAICLYILLILLVLLYLQKPKVKKYNSKIKETVIEINLVEFEKKIKKELNNINPTKKEKILIKNSTSTDSKVKTNLKSLFANVKTKSIKISKKKVLNVKENKVQSRFKSKYKNNIKTDNIKVSNLKKINKEIISKNTKGDKNDMFDKYYSEIKQLLLTRWYKNPIYNTDSYLIKVYVNINTKGQFSFNIIKYSGNIEIDNILNKFLNEQKNIIYPISKDKKSKTILINFMNEKG
jgi:protein TonB